jgi:twinkle protein
VPKDANDALR